MGNSPKIYELWRQAARLTSRRERDRQIIRDFSKEVLRDYDPVIESEAAAIGRELKGTFQLYVGADNVDGYVHVAKLTGVLSRRHEGWTVVTGSGEWRGQSETCVIVTLSDNAAYVYRTAEIIARELSQQSVGVVRIGDAMEFVS